VSVQQVVSSALDTNVKTLLILVNRIQEGNEKLANQIKRQDKVLKAARRVAMIAKEVNRSAKDQDLKRAIDTFEKARKAL
jgi:hypothetical protein